jgi:hypothetical protein
MREELLEKVSIDIAERKGSLLARNTQTRMARAFSRAIRV